MISALLNEPLTLEHRGETSRDTYNNAVVGTSSSEEVLGYLEQQDAQEITLDRTTYIADWRAFLPAGTTITAGDRLTRDSDTFEVIGPPALVYNPRLRQTSHIECKLRVTTG